MEQFVYCFTDEENSRVFVSPLDTESMWAHLAAEIGESLEETKGKYTLEVKQINPQETRLIISFYCTDGLISLR